MQEVRHMIRKNGELRAVKLFLNRWGDGSTHLEIEGPGNKIWSLLRFGVDGTVVLDADVPAEAGLLVDGLGHMVVGKEI